MKRANAYEEDRRTRDRFVSTLVIAASIIAAVRLARDEKHLTTITVSRNGHFGLCWLGADDPGAGTTLGAARWGCV